MSTKPLVAMLGLGTMGAGMAHRLLAADFPLKLFNRNPERYRSFEGSAAQLCESPAQAAADADIVIGMVSDDDVSRAVWQGPAGALSGARRGAVLIESSTLSLGWVRKLSELSEAQGCHFLDAPVTGSKAQAQAGTLKFLVGGDAATIDKATSVLSAMGIEIVPLGPVGSGTVLKLVNNFVCGVQVTALTEGLAMLERFDLNQEAALMVLVKGAAGSPLVQTIASRIAANDFAPNFSVSLIAKDLAYAINEAANVGIDLTSAEAAHTRFRQAQSSGFGGQDISSLVEFLRKSRDINGARPQ
jgi:3-hydroxyisobutyrate dehydrogenase